MGWLDLIPVKQAVEEPKPQEMPSGETFSGMKAPLSSLYQNKFEHQFLQYPLNIESAEENHWVRFDIQALKGTDIEQNAARSSAPGDTLTNISDAAAPTIGAVSSSVNQFLQDRSSGKVGGIGAALQERVRGLGSIMLYAPHSRQDTLKFNWQQGAIGQAGAALIGAGGSAGTAWDTVNSLSDNATLQDIQSQSGRIADLLATKILGKSLGNDQFQNIMLRSKGKALNPHLEMFFQNVDFRTFTFDFKLAPRNSQEAEAIRQIIKMLKYSAAPAYASGAAGIFFEYPQVFDISMHNEEQTHKIARSCLTSIQVDHSGSGVNSTFYDNYPVETNMNLVFTEMEIMHKDKIGEGF